MALKQRAGAPSPSPAPIPSPPSPRPLAFLRCLCLSLCLVGLHPPLVSGSALQDQMSSARHSLRSLLKLFQGLQRSTHNLSPIQRSAVHSCIDQFQEAIERTEQASKSAIAADGPTLAIFISAAMQLAQTCKDEVQLANGITAGGGQSGPMVGQAVAPWSANSEHAGTKGALPDVPIGGVSSILSGALSGIKASRGSSSSSKSRRRLLQDSDDDDGHDAFVRGGRRDVQSMQGRRKAQAAPAAPAATSGPAPLPKPMFTVDPKGTSGFTSIQAAIDKLPKGSDAVAILIKAGTYKERLKIVRKGVVLIGEGQESTIITGSWSVIFNRVTTSLTPTVTVKGDRFVAVNLRIVNASPLEGHQAVAIMINADKAAFYNCTFQSFQDTLYAHVGRHYYRNVTVIGTIDFVFGNAAAYFDTCSFLLRKNLNSPIDTVTAQSRIDKTDVTGFVIYNSNVTGYSKTESPYIKGYLGRDWKPNALVVYLYSYLDTVITSDGWIPWNLVALNHSTPYYAEYRNTGPSSNFRSRPSWVKPGGLKRWTQTTSFSKDNWIQGNLWVGQQGVPYN